MSTAETTDSASPRTYGYVGKILIAISLVALALLVWKLKEVVLLAFGGVLFAIILNAAAGLVQKITHLSHKLSLVLATILLLLGLIGAVDLFGQEIATQLGELASRLPGAWDDLRKMLGSAGIREQFDAQIAKSVPDGKTILGWVSYLVSGLTGALSGLFVAILGGIYCAAQPDLYRRGLHLMLPDKAQKPVEEAVDATGHALRAWLLGQMMSMLFTGFFISIGLLILGVPSSLALGLIAGLMGFVPMIGPLLGAAPGVLVALTVDPHTFLLTALLYFVVQQIAGNVVEPLIMQRTVKLPPALTLFSLFGTGTLFGVVGVLLGGPLLVTVYVMVRHLYVKYGLGHDIGSGAE